MSALPSIDVAGVMEQVYESYQEFAELIEPNRDMEKAIEVLETRRDDHIRAISALFNIEVQCRNELRFVDRFPAPVGPRARSALYTLMECVGQLRIVL